MEAFSEAIAEVSEVIREVSVGDGFFELNTVDFLLALRSERPTSQRAFSRLVQITEPKLSRFLARYLRSENAIQEALQETYLGVFRGLSRFEGKCRLTTWIYSLAYRKACDGLAQKYRRNLHESDLAQFEDQWEEQAQPDLGPDEILHQGRLVHEIMEASKELPEIYLAVYQLRDLNGLSGEEAAAILGITPTLIRVRLHRARALIVERLRKKLPSLFQEVN